MEWLVMLLTCWLSKRLIVLMKEIEILIVKYYNPIN